MEASRPLWRHSNLPARVLASAAPLEVSCLSRTRDGAFESLQRASGHRYDHGQVMRRPRDCDCVSGHGTLLPIPDDPRFPALIEAWPDWPGASLMFPRSAWLREFESMLREHYPHSSSRDRSLTARHAAPFWLKDGPNVP